MESNSVCTIRVTNKIGRPCSGSPICLITSMITDQIGQQEVLLPVNHNYTKICYILGLFLIKTQEIRRVFFLNVAVKKSHLNTCMRWCVLSNYRHDVYSPYYTVLLLLHSGQLIANQIWEFCYRYNYDYYLINYLLLVLTSHLFSLTQGWKLGSSSNLELTKDNDRSGIPDSLQHESICYKEKPVNLEVWSFLFISKQTSVRHKVLERCTSAHGQPLFSNFIIYFYSGK